MLYGPFLRKNIRTTESSMNFDKSLKLKNPLWGLCGLDDVNKIAFNYGFKLDKIIEMPSNNLSVCYRYE